MAPKVPISEIGTTSPGMSVALASLRNRYTTSTTKMTESSNERSTSFSAARMVGERSMTENRSIADGIAACNCGRTSLTRLIVSMMLAPG